MDSDLYFHLDRVVNIIYWLLPNYFHSNFELLLKMFPVATVVCFVLYSLYCLCYGGEMLSADC